jgi:hypothetical protein
MILIAQFLPIDNSDCNRADPTGAWIWLSAADGVSRSRRSPSGAGSRCGCCPTSGTAWLGPWQVCPSRCSQRASEPSSCGGIDGVQPQATTPRTSSCVTFRTASGCDPAADVSSRCTRVTNRSLRKTEEPMLNPPARSGRPGKAKEGGYICDPAKPRQ